MQTAPREKELRLALVCYGGVSLAIYMHGVTKELWKLLKASEARQAGRAVPEGDSEPVWKAMLDRIGTQVDLRIICDIITGASAGGINAVLLGRAIASGHDMEPLRKLWLEKADIDVLLDPDARPDKGLGRLGQFYKEPVGWFASRQSESLARVDDPAIRAEIAVKLSRFVRSRWFKPPFSGDGFTALLDEALLATEQGVPGPALVPPTMGLDLFVTVTDYFGVTARLPIHSPPAVTEREHRRLFCFRAPPVMQRGDLIAARGAGRQAARAHGLPQRSLGERAELLFAARATASFPGAFPPATLGEIDRRLAALGEVWPRRHAFLRDQLASDRAPEDIALIDGSVLNNAPFGPAIDAVKMKPSHREVDRRFVYIDPKPDGAADVRGGKPPGFFTAILRALADIPREQPIRDSLEAIGGLSARIRRLRAVLDGLTPAVDAAILRAVGPRFFYLPLGPDRLAKARSRVQSLAAREAGFAFAAYAQLKLQRVLDEAAALLCGAAALEAGDAAQVRSVLFEVAERRGVFLTDAATGRAPEASGYVQVLKGLDIGFRVRRLRFVVKRLTAEIAASPSAQERAAAEAVKSALYAAISPFVVRRSVLTHSGRDGLGDVARKIARASGRDAQLAAGELALDRLIVTLDLSTLDRAADEVLAAAAVDSSMDRPMRHALIRAWLGFPFYDIALLPQMQDDSADSLDEIRVDRISPDDATALREGGTRACLKGWQLNAFGAFFSRGWRENDYLWGRLHAADRLVDIVINSACESGAHGLDARAWKKEVFAAILAAERPHLGAVQGLVDELEGVLATWKD